MKERVPVVYVGKQKGATDDEYLDLVDEPGGYTKVFDPIKHVIVGLTERALKLFEGIDNHPKIG